MTVFIDTSAFLAVLDGDDEFHSPADKVWNRLLMEGTALGTTNYVLVETTALLQSRLGVEAVRAFAKDIMPLLIVEWITPETHQAALAALLTAARRRLSLVDCTSFEVIRQRGIASVFAFDVHFQEQGFADVASSAI